jgi:hypothetical protein
MSTPPIPQTTVSQSGMLSRSPGAKNLPSRPMMMPAMITPRCNQARRAVPRIANLCQWNDHDRPLGVMGQSG